MGYTHYFYLANEISPASWSEFIADFEKIYEVGALRIILGNGFGHFSPQVDSEKLVFNGLGESSHETFYLERVHTIDKADLDQYDEEKRVFNFCKTAQKPYDIAVCGALIIAKKVFGDKIHVTSDGTNEDWQEAKDLLVQSGLDYGEMFVMDDTKGGVF